MPSRAVVYPEWPIPPGSFHSTYALVDGLREYAEQQGRIARRRAEAQRLVEALTPRERDVLRGVVAGLSNKGIARQLGISPRTVEIHRANMMARLNAHSTSDVVRIGVYAGFDD